MHIKKIEPSPDFNVRSNISKLEKITGNSIQKSGSSIKTKKYGS
jgi:hypothetical protein